jgi:hypothetical protein
MNKKAVGKKPASAASEWLSHLILGKISLFCLDYIQGPIGLLRSVAEESISMTGARNADFRGRMNRDESAPSLRKFCLIIQSRAKWRSFKNGVRGIRLDRQTKHKSFESDIRTSRRCDSKSQDEQRAAPPSEAVSSRPL